MHNLAEIGLDRQKTSRNRPDFAICAIWVFEMTELSRGNLTCQVCPDPGACCRNFPLYGSITKSPTRQQTRLEAIIWAAGMLYQRHDLGRYFVGMPFLPTEYDEKIEGWRWRCVDLAEDGSCSNYANRPFGPCAMYAPQEDHMCALFPEDRLSLWSRGHDGSAFEKASDVCDDELKNMEITAPGDMGPAQPETLPGA